LLILQNQHKEILLVKRSLKGIWGGLWSFIECEEEQHALTYCKQHGYEILHSQPGAMFRHTFSHFHLDILPLWVTVKTTRFVLSENQAAWYLPSALPAIGLAAPIKKILAQLRSPSSVEFVTKKR
jgi:A/G-specific adenine glycosylase